MRLTKKRADNGRYYLSGLAEVSNSYPKGYGRIQVGQAVEKLAEYEDLDEQGKLLKLPCAVGNVVWCVHMYSGGGRVPDWGEIFKSKFTIGMYNDFGKTVFLTKEEAESALEVKNETD